MILALLFAVAEIAIRADAFFFDERNFGLIVNSLNKNNIYYNYDAIKYYRDKEAGQEYRKDGYLYDFEGCYPLINYHVTMYDGIDPEKCNEIARSDRRLNRAYVTAMGKLSLEDRIKLRANQNLWIKYRNKKCKSTDIIIISDYVIGDCFIKYAYLRTDYLKNYK